MNTEKSDTKKIGNDINRKTIDDAQFELNETRMVLLQPALKKKKSINAIEKMQKKKRRNNEKISKRMSGRFSAQDIRHSIAQTPTAPHTQRNIFSMLNELE